MPEGNGTWSGLGSSSGNTYVLSEEHNQFVVTGCNLQGMLLGDSRNVIIDCSSFCSIRDIWANPVVSTSRAPGDGAVACSGVGCCQTPIPIGRPNYTVEFKYLDLEYMGKLPMAMRIAERGWFDGVAAQMLNESATDEVQQVPVPVVLDWVVASTPVALPGSTAAEDTGNWSCPVDAARSACRSSHSTCHNVTGNYRNGYVCRCQDGYDGNPYLAGGGGCQGMHGHRCVQVQQYLHVDIDLTCLFGVCFNRYRRVRASRKVFRRMYKQGWWVRVPVPTRCSWQPLHGRWLCQNFSW